MDAFTSCLFLSPANELLVLGTGVGLSSDHIHTILGLWLDDYFVSIRLSFFFTSNFRRRRCRAARAFHESHDGHRILTDAAERRYLDQTRDLCRDLLPGSRVDLGMGAGALPVWEPPG